MGDLERIDLHPTHHIAGYDLRPGRPLPYGATRVPGGINFSVASMYATACTLVLYERPGGPATVEIPFPPDFKVGKVFAMVVFGLDAETVEYGYRVDGPWDPDAGHRFDPSIVLLDPFARAISGRPVYGVRTDAPLRSRIGFDDFDWEGVRPPGIPMQELVVYEMHVRSFTRHPASGVRHPGTFGGLREKIPHLLELGVNCVELMPIFEFDELAMADDRLDYWGYGTVGYFAPKAGYAVTGPLGMQIDEFKNLVKTLHANGIEVVLDVVFNHTGEGDERGPTVSFRGIDNKSWYMLAPDGSYRNFSGTGNTLNCNHPLVRSMVLECLHAWVSEYHIDGFRFDLASILGRDTEGHVLDNPPLLETLAHDPVLANVKLIAEAWDAGGLYQVGNFPHYDGRFAEWNGCYRDAARRFLRGDDGQVKTVAECVMGSPELYPWRGPMASVNFITCHDGFTLADLWSYDRKHNDANGEDNRDGADHNDSWNCGVEGPTENPAIRATRGRMARNSLALLLLSRGVPMLLMGDEMGRSQQGNNNPYCHDGPVGWVDWRLCDTNADLLRFARQLVALRRACPVLRAPEHPTQTGDDPDIVFHGVQPDQPEWAEWARTLAFEWRAAEGEGGVYAAFNMHWQGHVFTLPPPPAHCQWHQVVDTHALSPGDFTPLEEAPPLRRSSALVGPRSCLVLVARRA